MQRMRKSIPKLEGKILHVDQQVKPRRLGTKSSGTSYKATSKNGMLAYQRRHTSSSSESLDKDSSSRTQKSISADGLKFLSRESRIPATLTDKVDGGDMEYSRHRRGSGQSDISVFSQANLPKTQWEEFTEYVRSIDVDSMSFQQKRFRSKSSLDFKSAMEEIQAAEVKHARKHSTVLLRALNKARASHSPVDTNIDDANHDDSKSDDEPSEEEKLFRNTARRKMSIVNWDKVKHKLTDVRKKSDTTVGWNVLSQALSSLSEKEKARQMLYAKYIEHPNSWADGFSATNYPVFLKERQEKANDKPKRPMTTGGMRSGIHHNALHGVHLKPLVGKQRNASTSGRAMSPVKNRPKSVAL